MPGTQCLWPPAAAKHKLTVAPGGVSFWCPRLAAPHSAQPSHWRASSLAGHAHFFLTQRLRDLEPAC